MNENDSDTITMNNTYEGRGKRNVTALIKTKLRVNLKYF